MPRKPGRHTPYFELVEAQWIPELALLGELAQTCDDAIEFAVIHAFLL